MVATRPVLIGYAALSFWAALFALLPSLAMLFGILTLGLAYLVPSIWLYATAAMPGFMLWRAGAPGVLGAAVSIAAVAALALVPAKFAAQEAEQLVVDYTSGDFRKALPKKPQHIELVRDGTAFIRPGDDPIEHAVCDELCQRLLLTRQVTSVTVTARGMNGEPLVVGYALRAMDRCPTAFDIKARILPSATKARIEGLCIVPSRGIGMMSGLIIRHDELVRRFVPTFALVSAKHVVRLEVSERSNGAEVPLLRSTEVTVGQATAPLSVFPYAGLLTSVKGNAISKNERNVNPLPLLSLMEELGFSLGLKPTVRPGTPLQALILTSERPLQADRSMVATLLAQPGAGPFDYDLQLAAAGWTQQFWSGKAERDADDLTVFSALIRDRRVQRLGAGNPIWRGEPGLVALLADPILTRLTWPVTQPQYDADRPFAQLIARQDDAFLAEHQERLLTIVTGVLSRNTSPLLRAAAELGDKGLPPILAGMASTDVMVRIDAVEAACHARPDIAPRLLTAMRAMLDGQGVEDGYLIVVVAVLDGVEAAKELIERQPEGKRKRLTQILARATVDGAPRCES